MKRTTPIRLLLALVLLCASWPAFAHHQTVAQFSRNKPVTLRGTVTKLEWINPHGWIHLDVKGPDGKVEAWAVETGSPYVMTKRGLQRTDFQYGTEVIIGAFAAIDGSRRAAGWVVTFPARETAAAEKDATFSLGR
jgi:hypothetical protein